MQQPLLGILGTIVAVGGSMLLVANVSPATTGTWLTLAITSIIPLQFIAAVDWHHQYPTFVARLPQPFRGLAFLSLFAVAGAVASVASVWLLGGGVTPPTPFPSTYLIYAVQVAIWIIIGFQNWPMSLIPNPAIRAGASLIAIYSATAMLYFTLFNFAPLAGAPFYIQALDPGGPFVMWAPVTFTMTAVGVLLTLLYFDFQPIGMLAARWPVFGRQPWFGLTALAFCSIVGWVIWALGSSAMNGDLVVYLGKVACAYVFGVLMVINLFEMAPFIAVRQPYRGVVLTLATCLLAALVYPAYTYVARLAFGGLASGPPAYDLELWLASSLLAVTFPVITLYAGAFNFWPFRNKGRPAPGLDSAALTSDASDVRIRQKA